MENLKLKINKNSYSLKFGIGCLRLLGKEWNLDSVNAVMNRLVILDTLNESDLSFEVLDILVDVIKCAIKCDADNVIDEKDFEGLEDYLFNNVEAIKKIFEGLVESMPKQEKEKKPIPAKVKKSLGKQ